ncbi:MAG TPA: DUF975 family protein [Candidatus Cloacimonas acidaminovorans]|nr:DUF975 family protein [Candidatus Cloacimonas acidaminovorans]HRU83393.1 DUF975 family protein [Candidatus Cloacimonas sp.]
MKTNNYREKSEVMMLTYTEIRYNAREYLKGKWNNPCALIILIIAILNAGLSAIPFLGTVISLLITGPITLGLAIVFLKLVRGEEISVELVFSGFKDFARSFTAGVLVIIYVFLWSLLLIIPGIVASFAYSMTFFIMADNPNLSANDAIRVSKEMMKGHKAELFWLELSFLGWILLGCLSFGIGFLWIWSYIYTAKAIFYHEIRAVEVSEVIIETPYEEQTVPPPDIEV